jgi:MtaA/CmuA family methyltransferase
METPDPLRDGRSPVVLEAVSMLRRALGSESPVLCGVISAFTLAGQLRGESNALMDLIIDPDFLKAVLEKAVRWDVEYARAAVEAGADVIVLVDATASGDLLGPEQYQEFALPHQLKVARAVREAGAKSIMHICGNTTLNLPLMRTSGVDGIGVDQSMDLAAVKVAVGPDCADKLTSDTKTVSIYIDLVNDVPELTKAGDDQTVQYSDTIAAMTITATDVDSDADELQATAPDLPAGLSMAIHSTTATERVWMITGAPTPCLPAKR